MFDNAVTEDVPGTSMLTGPIELFRTLEEKNWKVQKCGLRTGWTTATHNAIKSLMIELGKEKYVVCHTDLFIGPANGYFVRPGDSGSSILLDGKTVVDEGLDTSSHHWLAMILGPKDAHSPFLGYGLSATSLVADIEKVTGAKVVEPQFLAE